MIVMRRTFAAKYYPLGSETRKELNLSPLTSEYMPSYKYVVCEDDRTTTPFTYQTKAEAQAKAEGGSK